MAIERLGHSPDTWAIRFVHLRHKTVVSHRHQGGGAQFGPGSQWLNSEIQVITS